MKLFLNPHLSPLSHIGMQSAAVSVGAFAIGAAVVAGFVKLSGIILAGESLGVSFVAFYVGMPLCALILTGLASGAIALVRHFHANAGGTGLQVLDHGTKLVVTEVAEGSPAQKSGIKVGDVIRDIDGVPVSFYSAKTVSSLLGDKDYSAGSVVSVRVTRPSMNRSGVFSTFLARGNFLHFAVTRAPLTTVKDQQLDDAPENVTADSNQVPGATTCVRTTFRREVRASTLQQTEVVYTEGANLGSQQPPAASSSVRQNANFDHIVDEDAHRLPAIGHGAGSQTMVAVH